MLRKISIICLVVAMLISFPVKGFADVIGYVNMQSIFADYKEANKAQEELEKKQKELEKELTKRQDKIEAAKKKNKSEEALKKMYEKFEKELQPKKEALLKLNSELTTKIRRKIIAAVKTVSKEYGIDVVVAKQAVLYGGFNLTDFVLEKLNN